MGQQAFLEVQGRAGVVQRVGVRAATEDDLAAAGLLHVAVQRRRADQWIEERLVRLGDHRLQRVGVDRRADTGLGHQQRAGPGHRLDHAAALHGATVGADRLDAAVADQQVLHFGQLMNLHAAFGRLLGIAPGHRVVAGGGAVDVPQPGQHRQVAGVEVQTGHQLADLLAVEHLATPAEVFVDLGALAEGTHAGVGVRQGQLAAFGVHDVEVELVGQVLEHPHRFRVEAHAFAGEVVGADHRRVACGIAAAQIGLFQDGDVAHPVVLGQVIGDGQAMAASADDHHVIVRLEFARWRQVDLHRVVGAQAVFQQGERHAVRSCWAACCCRSRASRVFFIR
ncbi:hypothetical protein D3C79_503940 [compost metagenome]